MQQLFVPWVKYTIAGGRKGARVYGLYAQEKSSANMFYLLLGSFLVLL
jgi:hypothetical protein